VKFFGDKMTQAYSDHSREHDPHLGTAHSALADAKNQAIRANQIVRKLGIKLT
jgi:hypothetical protein